MTEKSDSSSAFDKKPLMRLPCTRYTVFDRQIIMTDDALKKELIHDLDRLSGESLREVRDFIQFLQRKSSSASVFDTIDERRDAVPEEEWEEVPTDASARLDKYLYRSDSL